MSVSPSPAWPCPIYLDSCSYTILFFTASDVLSPADTSTAEHHFHFGPVTSFFLELLVIALHPSPVAYCTPSNLGRLLFQCPVFFAFSYCPWGSPGRIMGVGCHFLLQGTTFCQNSSLWPICLVWPCPAWLIAYLSYISPFAMTRPWSMKGILSFSI